MRDESRESKVCENRPSFRVTSLKNRRRVHPRQSFPQVQKIISPLIGLSLIENDGGDSRGLVRENRETLSDLGGLERR